MMNLKKQVFKLFLILLILVFSTAMINTAAMANSKYGRLTGVNWFGFETGNFVAHGLWNRDYKSMLQQIKDMGFNCIRLPWSYNVLSASPTGIQIGPYGVDKYTGQTGMNMDLEGLTSMEVMDKIIDHANTLGLKIILDCHSLAHDGYMAEPVWYTSAYPESTWISGWKSIITRYKNRANVIGADLKNEPHGNLGQGNRPPACWGFDAPGYPNTNWKAAAERCGKEILAINPNIVIFVEGTEMAEDQTTYWWGGNLKDVGKYPITSIPAANLEYSFHEYGSGVFNQTWFSDPNFPRNMAAIWDEHFYYIQKQGIGQLLLGEFGITEANAANPSSVDYKWLTTLMAYVGNTVDWTFWSWNPNSGDTGGILLDDWVTVNTAKFNLVKPYLAGSGPVVTPTPGNPTPTPVRTPTPVVTATPTPTFVVTPTPTPTPVRTATPRQTATPRRTATPRGTATPRTTTPVRTATPVVSIVPSPETPSPTPTPVATATPVPTTGSIKVQLFNQNTAATSNQVYPNIKLVNTGTSAITLSSVKIRYYYTIDGAQPQTFYCDYSSVGASNVIANFVTMATALTGADTYVEIGFSSGAASLAAGANVTIQGRFSKNNWANYTQTNDYSFNSTGTGYVDWTKVTGYVSGVLQWGIEP
jgi:aryl-phospho-beta-D-glucosidase BglC (GH1 family)